MIHLLNTAANVILQTKNHKNCVCIVQHRNDYFYPELNNFIHSTS